MRAVSEAVQYPSTGEDWLQTILIGGILSFLGFLLIPILFVYGYLMGVIRKTHQGEQEPPTFGDWGKLLVDGAQAFVIGLLYMLIPLVVATVTIGASVLAILTGTEVGFATGIGGLFVGLVATSILVIVFGYVAVAGIVHFALEERFSAAFELGTLKPILFHREYAVAWLMSFLVLLVAGAISGFLNVIPVIGTIVGAFVGFYAAMVAATLWSDGFTDAMEAPETVETHGVEESPA